MTPSQQKLPPSVKPFWIGGHFRPFRKDPTGFLTTLAGLGDVTYFTMGKQPAYFINHPEMVRDLFVVNAHKFHKGRALQRAKGLLGDGLLTSEEEFHLRQRRLVQPAFHRARIAGYAQSMIDYGDKMSGGWVDGAQLDISHEMMRLTLHIVAKTLFSANVEDEADEIGATMTTIIEMFNFLLLPFSEILEKLPLPQAKRLRKARATLDNIIYGFIDERRKSGEDKGDLLSMLLLSKDDDGSVMTDKQVHDECLTLFMAGHETTANAMTWTWYMISRHPEVEAKFHAELDRVLAGRAPAPDDYAQLKYTEMVFAEAMRLYPPAWVVGRLAVAPHEFGGYQIAPNSLLLASQYVLQRDTRFWENADKFIPERWENISVKEASNKFIYFPFGGGVRRCIGEQFAWMEGVLLLAALGRRWKLNLAPEQKIVLQPLMTLRSKFGMKMKVERR